MKGRFEEMKAFFLMLVLVSLSVAQAGSWMSYAFMQGENSVAPTGTYRAMYFDITDFQPYPATGRITGLRLYSFEWIHHPWDTSEFYFEVWSGDENGPDEKLFSEQATAYHLAPTFIGTLQDSLYVGPTFWVVQNTEISANGSPSLCGDSGGPDYLHSSFSSYDFVNWILWDPVPDTYPYIDYKMEVCWVAAPQVLSAMTWGGVKALF